MKTSQQNNVFDITLSENSNRMKKMSHNRIPWHLRAISKVESWVLSNIYKLDTTSERIIRFYTYNDEKGEEFDFKCPNYTYDIMSCLYDDFVEVSHEIGEILQEQYGVVGRYFYDVKVSLTYERCGNPFDGYDWDMNYSWNILKTDNPRCVLGNPNIRKDCYYLNNFNSKLVIEGYTLSGNYKKLADILSDLVSKTIIVHSKSDAKAVLRIMKFLGVQQVSMGGKYYYNNPDSRAHFSKYRYGYQLDRIDGETVMCIIPRCDVPVTSQEVLDIDEFIVKRSLKARLRDIGGNHGRRKRNSGKRASSHS